VKTAKLPIECVAEKRRLISELAMGETGYVGLSSLIVTPEQDCFLDAKGSLEKPRLLTMTVRRYEDGLHVVLPAAPEYTAQPLFQGSDVLPIASIMVSKDKWFPGPRASSGRGNRASPLCAILISKRMFSARVAMRIAN
jgi:hypothetical protein